MRERCHSKHAHLRCCGDEGHRGAHWADVGRRDTVLRWGMVGYGCPDPECVRAGGHATPHRNRHGMSWWPIDPDWIDWQASDHEGEVRR